MGFSSSNHYSTPSTPVPVVTTTSTGETKEAMNQASAQKKGLLSTILSAHRRKENTDASRTGNATLG